MTPTSMAALVRHLRKITNPCADSSVSDAELLERFVHRRDEAAFELLVWRHQRLVLGVCRRVLGDAHEAEDAFQATFLALARKAAAVGRGDAVASWLHTVALRIALRTRAATQRMKTNIELAAIESRADPAAEAERRDLAAVLDEEIDRLPRKYRVPVVLCYLEGKSYAEATRQLGVAAGTLAGRLMRARQLLRKRLLRRGIGISGAFLAAVLGEQASLAAAPAALVNITVKAAASLLLGETAAAGAISPTVAALAEGALRSMVVSKLKLGMVVLLAGLLTTGMGLFIPAAFVSPAIVNETLPPAAPSAESKEKIVRVDDYGDPLPDGALRRLGTMRFRHGGGINNLLLTPDGKTLVSNDRYGTRTVCVWEVATGKLRHRLPGSEEEKHIALSPDGRLVAVGQEKVIVLWDLVSGKEVRRLAQANATGCAFSPDGKILAAAGSDPQDLHLWDPTTGKKIAQFDWKRHTTSAVLLAFTPDGKTLIAGQELDSKIILWDMPTGKKRRELDAEFHVHSFALSPDGAILATGSRQDGILAAGSGQGGGIPLWDVKTGKLIHKLRTEAGKACTSVAFSPNGKTLAAGENDYQGHYCLSLWDVVPGKELRRIKGDSQIANVLFSRDGKTLIASSGGTIRLFDTATGKEMGPTAGSSEYGRFATMSADGRTLAYLRDYDVRFWDMKAGREVGGSIKTPPDGLLALALSPDGRTAAVHVGEYDINLWDVKDRKLRRQLAWDKKDNPNDWSRTIAFSPDGRLLASGHYTSNIVRIWERASGKQVLRLQFNDDKKAFSTIETVVFSPDGKTLAVSGRGNGDSSKVRLWDVGTGKPLTHLNVHLNDPADKGPPETQQFPGGPIVESRILFSPNGWMMAMNRWQKTIPVWEAATGRQRLLLEGHEASTACVAFTSDGRTLASASWDETIRLWDLGSGRELRKLTGHRGKANSLAFSADGKTLVSAGDDETVLFWDVADITDRKNPQIDRLAAREWQAMWEDLAKDDAAKAYAAMVRMSASGPAVIAALKERLHPVRPADPERLARLFKDLDGDEFAVREAANRELEKLGDVVRPTARQTLARAGLSLELRRRLEVLSSSLDEISGERLRQLRAIEVLERLGTAEARELLKAMAGGAPEALATTAAQVALKRLQR